jgi:hypothetical protein
MIFALDIKNIDPILLSKLGEKIPHMRIENVHNLYRDGVIKAWFYHYEESDKIDLVAVIFKTDPNKIVQIMNMNDILNDVRSIDLSSNSQSLDSVNESNFSTNNYTNISVEELEKEMSPHNEEEYELDDVLDSISKNGYDNIPQSMKDFLKNR